MIATIFIHPDKDALYELGAKLGLTGEALRMFRFACNEMKVLLEVNPSTGFAEVVEIDDRKVLPRS